MPWKKRVVSALTFARVMSALAFHLLRMSLAVVTATIDPPLRTAVSHHAADGRETAKSVKNYVESGEPLFRASFV